jgi:hypothetical protein
MTARSPSRERPIEVESQPSARPIADALAAQLGRVSVHAIAGDAQRSGDRGGVHKLSMCRLDSQQFGNALGDDVR